MSLSSLKPFILIEMKTKHNGLRGDALVHALNFILFYICLILMEVCVGGFGHDFWLRVEKS
jgi:hypothetical protein